jgi:triosephosphate isomerase (TIM)
MTEFHGQLARTICANWKMNHLPQDVQPFINDIEKATQSCSSSVVLCLPATHLAWHSNVGAGSSKVLLGSQDNSEHENGPYTGCISAAALQALGCRYGIVGHSERRQYFGETNVVIGKKARKLLDHSITPIICIGETLQQRQLGSTLDVLSGQLSGIASAAEMFPWDQCFVAYEPVWAIGTGVAATTLEVQQTHQQILAWFESSNTCKGLLYGGSVQPSNAHELFTLPDVHGALVGGASLDSLSFAAIISAAG